MLSHINLSWLILHQIWEQFPGVLVKMRGTCYLPIILPRRQSVCLWHDWEPREIAWHHFNFWICLALGRWIPKPVLSIGWYRSCWHTSFAPCTKSFRKTSPGEVTAAWKVEDFLFFLFFLLCFFFCQRWADATLLPSNPRLFLSIKLWFWSL